MLLPIMIAAGVFVAFTHVAPFRFILDAIHRDKVIWKMPVQGSEKPLYLTFDDGPNPLVTPELLSLLEEKDVKATFFVIDDFVTEETAPIVRRMFEEGHCVAQHTGRRWLLLRSPSHVEHLLQAGADKIERLTGHRPGPFFRPHAGWRSGALFRGAARAGYRVVGWSFLNFDWVWFRKRTGPRVARHLINRAAPGNIMIIHDGHYRNPRSKRDYVIGATRTVVDELRAQGYTLRTLCEDSPPPVAAGL